MLGCCLTKQDKNLSKNEPGAAFDLLLDEEDGSVVGDESGEYGLEPPVDHFNLVTVAAVDLALEHRRHDVPVRCRRRHLGLHGLLQINMLGI